MRAEDGSNDVLQNIEAMITANYRINTAIIDFNVIAALDAAIDLYAAEKTGRMQRSFKLSGLEQSLYESIKSVCDWRLGRSPLKTAGDKIVESPKPKTVDEIVKSLRKIQKSAIKWNRDGGKRGYLDFIVDFV
jgi:pyruvate/2-oxoglutarate/acetoin dehydrogenase E1 component